MFSTFRERNLRVQPSHTPGASAASCFFVQHFSHPTSRSQPYPGRRDLILAQAAATASSFILVKAFVTHRLARGEEQWPLSGRHVLLPGNSCSAETAILVTILSAAPVVVQQLNCRCQRHKLPLPICATISCWPTWPVCPLSSQQHYSFFPATSTGLFRPKHIPQRSPS